MFHFYIYPYFVIISRTGILISTGFQHSAFAFAHESFLVRSNISGGNVPPGALVTFIQRGLQYIEVESHLNEVCNIFREFLVAHGAIGWQYEALYSTVQLASSS